MSTNTKDANKRFSKTPDLSAILNSESAKDFIKSGEAADNTASNETPSKSQPKETKKTKPATVAIADDMTWMNTDPSLRVQHIVRVPAPLKLLIEYLGDTGKGMNQTSISVAGMTAIAETLAKERGLPLPESWGSWLAK